MAIFVLIFMWFLLSKVLANSHLLSYYKGIWLVFLQGCLIHMDLRCSPFWFLNLLEYLSKQFSSPVLVFCFSWQQLHSRFLASYLLASIRQVGLICFCIFKSSVLVFCRNSVFWFEYSLVYSHPKMFLLFFSLILSLV